MLVLAQMLSMTFSPKTNLNTLPILASCSPRIAWSIRTSATSANRSTPPTQSLAQADHTGSTTEDDESDHALVVQHTGSTTEDDDSNKSADNILTSAQPHVRNLLCCPKTKAIWWLGKGE